MTEEACQSIISYCDGKHVSLGRVTTRAGIFFVPRECKLRAVDISDARQRMTMANQVRV